MPTHNLQNVFKQPLTFSAQELLTFVDGLITDKYRLQWQVVKTAFGYEAHDTGDTGNAGQLNFLFYHTHNSMHRPIDISNENV